MIVLLMLLNDFIQNYDNIIVISPNTNDYHYSKGGKIVRQFLYLLPYYMYLLL